jgi:hypothetical protein
MKKDAKSLQPKGKSREAEQKRIKRESQKTHVYEPGPRQTPLTARQDPSVVPEATSASQRTADNSKRWVYRVRIAAGGA